MTKSESYYLILVCAAFVVFGVVMAASAIRYRRWLKAQPQPLKAVAGPQPRRTT